MDYIFGPLKYHLYILQLENYNLIRYWRLAFRRWQVVKDRRQTLVKTAKVRLLFFLTIALVLLLSITLASARDDYWAKLITFLIYFILYIGLLPVVFLSAAVLIIWPIDYLAKQTLIWRGKARLKKFPNLKIIGVTGSYGKTTMKEVLARILQERYKVLKTRENINTPIGISRQILKELDPSIEIYIVEMGAYHTGDIKKLCDIAKPDIAILTGINEAHLERFGSIERTIEAKFEIVSNSKPQALIVLNQDSQLARDNFQHFVGNRKVLWYSSEDGKIIKFVNAHNSLPYILGQVEGINFQTKILGNYITGVIKAGILIGRELGLTEKEIKIGINDLQPVIHRLQPILNTSTGVLVIDDSYNGNPEGANEAIEVLGRFSDQRKIYITPGLVEMGERTEDVHYRLGKHLSKVVSIVILIKNSVTPFIAHGLLDQGFATDSILWFDTAQDAHIALPKILKSGDVILFQNDWTDNYL